MIETKVKKEDLMEVFYQCFFNEDLKLANNENDFRQKLIYILENRFYSFHKNKAFYRQISHTSQMNLKMIHETFLKDKDSLLKKLKYMYIMK